MLSEITQAPISTACTGVSGYGAGDMRYTGLTSVKGLRTSPKQNGHTVNVKTRVGVTGGRVAEADVQPMVFHQKPINGRHARRRQARGTQRTKW
jgi:hypothetical protein